MAYSVSVRSHFSAAHKLRAYQGKCEALHGHNWKVSLRISCADLDSIAMVCDFTQIKKKLNKILKELDHSYLNNLPYFKKHNPTSEKIAEFIFCRLKRLIKDKRLILKEVTVWETDSASAIYSEDD